MRQQPITRERAQTSRSTSSTTATFGRVAAAVCATSRHRAKRKATSQVAKCPTSLVAGALQVRSPARTAAYGSLRSRSTTGNHRKPDPELAETKDEKKHVRENVLPTGKIEHETMQGRADVGDVPTAETLGTLARKVLSSSRHAARDAVSRRARRRSPACGPRGS